MMRCAFEDTLLLLPWKFAYVYTPVLPTSYTLSLMDALGHGTPVLAPSVNYVLRRFDPAHLRAMAYGVSRYEAPKLLSHEAPLLFDDVADARRKLAALASSPALRRRALLQGRRTFDELFDSRKIGAQWSEFLARIA